MQCQSLFSGEKRRNIFYIVAEILPSMLSVNDMNAKNVHFGIREETSPSRKHAYIILTPFNPTII